jgi:hypothetical protein
VRAKLKIGEGERMLACQVRGNGTSDILGVASELLMALLGVGV